MRLAALGLVVALTVACAAERPQAGGGDAPPQTLSGEFMCLSGNIAVVRMPGPFTIGPLQLPSYWEPDLRFSFKDATTWTDLTFPTRPLEARYEYDPATGRVDLMSQPGPPLYQFGWKHDDAGEEYLIQVADEGASSQYFCRKVGPP